jgi:hypothetical protein
MNDERRALQPEQEKGEMPIEGNGSAGLIVTVGFSLAAIVVPIAMWPLEGAMFSDHLPVVLAQLFVSAAILVGILWMVYSGFMDRHLLISLALAALLTVGGYALQDVAAGLMGTEQPSYIAIALGAWLGVIGFYSWRAATARVKKL